MKQLRSSTGGLLLKAFLLIYFLLLFVPSTPFFIPEFFLCLAFVTFLVSEDPDWSVWWEDSILFWLVLFCGWMSFSSLIDGFLLSQRYFSWFENGTLFALLAIFKNLVIRPLLVIFLLHHLASYGNQEDRLFVKVLMFLVFVKLLLVGYVDYVQNLGWATGHHFTAYAHYNLTGTLLNLFFPFVLYEAYESKKNVNRGFWLFLFYATVNGVYMTQSRGSIIAMFFSLVVFCGVFLFARFSRKNLILCNVLAAGVLVCLLVNPAGGYTKKRFEKTKFQGVKGMVETGSPVGGLSGRLTRIWPRTRDVFFDQPVLGYMLDSYRSQMFENFGSKLEFDPTHPHNFYLQLFFEGGVIGFVLFHVFAFYLLLEPLRLFVYSSFRVVAGITVPIAVLGEVYFHGVIAMFDYYWLILLVPWVYVFRADFGRSVDHSSERKLNSSSG